MIDTIRLICTARPTMEQLKLLWLKREDTICDALSKRDYYYNPNHKDDIQVRATYRPTSRTKESDQFSVEFSLALPQLVWVEPIDMS